MINIAIAQSGGPTAAINSSLAGVVFGAINSDAVDKVYGSLNGIEGVLSDNFIELNDILVTDEDFELLKKTPSTILGSCRHKLKDYDKDSAAYEKITEIFKKHDISAFFYIGGNDSMDTVMKLDAYFKKNSIDIKVLGVPKTIDNDLDVTDHTPGFGSAAKYVAVTMQEIIRDSRVYAIPSVTIVEIMGRTAGWLTASSCILKNGGEVAPHLIYLPESKFSTEKFLSDIREVQKKYKAVIVAVSEGIELDEDDKYSKFGFSSSLTDAFGHKYLSGVGKYLEHIVSDQIGCKVRSIELNVMQRCSSHLASLTDINESFEIGASAIKACLEGVSGEMMIFKRVSDEPYKLEISSCDINIIANQEKTFPIEWITPEGNNIKEEALKYFQPLILGEVDTVYENGLTKYFELNI